MSLRKIAVAAFAIAACAAVAVPYVIGLRVESAFRDAIAAAPAHYPYPVTLVHYRRGLFSADAVTRHDITLGPDAEHPEFEAARVVAVTLRHTISHGPRLDGLRLARIVNTLRLDEQTAAQAAVLFDGAEPLTVVVDAGLGGALHGTLTSPPIGAAGEASGLSWAGLQGRFRIDGRRFAGQLDGSGLRAGELAVGAIAMRADLVARDGGLWIGHFDTRLDTLAIEGPGAAVRLSQLSIASDTGEADGRLRSDNRMEIDALRFDALQIDQAELRFAIEGIDAAALSMLSAALNRHAAATGRGEDGLAERAAIAPALATVAAGQPKAVLDTLSFRMPEGAFKASGAVQYVGDDDLADFAPLSDVVASLDAEASMALLERMLADYASRPGPGEPAPDAAAAAARAKALLDGLIAQGVVSVDAGIGRSAVRFDHGMLSVNGNALSALAP